MLSDHVVSIDVAQQLKNLGVEQDSLFHWERLKSGEYYLQQDEFVGAFAEEWFSAFTVSELGILLPEWSSSHRDENGMWAAHVNATFSDVAPILDEAIEADARGKLLIAIIEKYPDYLGSDDAQRRVGMSY